MEKSLVTCKVCGVEKERILNGKYNYKDKKWIDVNGKAFNGKTCPECYKTQAAQRMKALRDKRKASTPDSI